MTFVVGTVKRMSVPTTPRQAKFAKMEYRVVSKYIKTK